MSRRTNNKIHGILMRPASINQEDNKLVFQTTSYSVTNNFLGVYRDHIAAMQIVAECAKIYILENWVKIDDWSNLNVVIEDNSGEPTEYYNYVEKENKSQHKFMVRFNERNKLKHNPIQTLSDVVLDPTDGDFSLIINGKNHLWISNDSVVIIAEYIETNLK